MKIPITFRAADEGLTASWPAGFTIVCKSYAGADLSSSLTHNSSSMTEMDNGSYVIDAPLVTVSGYLHISLTSRPTVTWYETWFDNMAGLVWDEASNDHNTAGTTGRRLRNIAEDVIWGGTCQAGSTGNTIVLDSGASSVDGAYDPALVSIISGTGAGQTRLILQYVGSTRTAVVDRDWKTTPSNDSVFSITADAGREHVNEGKAQAGGVNTITLNANASSLDNAYKGQNIFLRSGTGADQARRCLSYNGTTKVLTTTRDWGVQPDATTGYVILPSGAISDECLRSAIWNADLSTYVGTAGSVAAAIGYVYRGMRNLFVRR